MARLEELRSELAPLVKQKRTIDNRVTRCQQGPCDSGAMLAAQSLSLASMYCSCAHFK